MDSLTMRLEENWKFHLGEAEDAWYKGYDDSSWRDVVIPHDWSVEQPFSQEYSSGTGYLAGGTGWYRVRFTLPEEYRGKKISLLFDGVYKNSQVWCNSYYLGKRPNGYVPFAYDISEKAFFGDMDNEVSVKVTHTDVADSRWFTGTGITRKVCVLVEEAVHPVQNGIFFSTLYGDGGKSAQVEVSHEIVNEGTDKASVSLISSLWDAEGKKVLEVSSCAEFAPGEKKTIALNGCVKHPSLWSPESPYLYRLNTVLSVNGEEGYEVFSGKVGIRTFRFDADKGFFLNGKNRKLKGVCVHHDGGCLGAAMTKEVWERRLTALKEMGCDAIRTSHNPHMPELYDLCDEMGFLMMDEAFDEWENPKNKWSTGHNVYPPKHQGYFEDFPEWHEKDLAAMVLRDRNHPSIIMWSIGNEIDYPNDPYCHPLFGEMTGNNDKNKPAAERMYNPDKPNMERLSPIAAELAGIVRQYDSTRPVTLAAAFPELSSRLHYFDALDVVGYNYKEHLYEEDHRRFPTLPFLGSENGHSYQAWKAVRDNDYISGQFLWTGIDYLGEAHGWPIHGSSAGLLTLAGFPKARYYRRKSFWSESPMVYLATVKYEGNHEEWMPLYESWNYESGDKVLVRLFTNQPEAELFLNGKSLGARKELDGDGCMEWIVDYEPGELKAVAGKLSAASSEGCVSFTLHTTGDAAKLLLSRWRSARKKVENADGLHPVYQVEITVADSEGCRIGNADCLVEAQVTGSGVLLGLENGDLADNTPYSDSSRRAYEGRLIAYIRRTGDGAITLRAQAENLPEETLIIEENA